eukprot:COSAG01_NODE_21143_length_916_cov_0.749082_1_plen_157_part_10
MEWSRAHHTRNTRNTLDYIGRTHKSTSAPFSVLGAEQADPAQAPPGGVHTPRVAVDLRDVRPESPGAAAGMIIRSLRPSVPHRCLATLQLHVEYCEVSPPAALVPRTTADGGSFCAATCVRLQQSGRCSGVTMGAGLRHGPRCSLSPAGAPPPPSPR